MRKRSEIEADGKLNVLKQLEVLLDIRELLQKANKGAKGKPGRPPKNKAKDSSRVTSKEK